MIPISALLRAVTNLTPTDRCPFEVEGPCSGCRAWQPVAFAPAYDLGFCLRMLPSGVHWDLPEPVERPTAERLMAENKT